MRSRRTRSRSTIVLAGFIDYIGGTSRCANTGPTLTDNDHGAIDMAKHPIPTPERLRQLLSYDAETGILRWKDRSRDDFKSERSFSRFQSQCSGKVAFTSDKGTGYLQGTVEGRTLVAHRVIWAIVTGEWPDGLIDHINHDRKDNRLSNLRVVDAVENARNQSLRHDNKSGRVGVRWHRWTQGWIAMGRVNGKAVQLLHTKNYAEAVAAREKFERERGFHENHGK